MSDEATTNDLTEKDSPAVLGKRQRRPDPNGTKPNAFTELMKPKKKPQAKMQSSNHIADQQSRATTFAGRNGLGAYIANPEDFPKSRVIDYNDKFVIINDGFPKATVHLLILPRDPAKQLKWGQEAFDDPAFLAECVAEERRVRKIAADELRRRIGHLSASEQARTAAMQSVELNEDLPPGRDWDKEIISGTHAHPSMNHLHIHVISRDLNSECLKAFNHYMSFTTDFLIPLKEYPMPVDDPRRDGILMPRDMLCWRCGRNYGRRFAELKRHLGEEFNEWAKH